LPVPISDLATLNDLYLSTINSAQQLPSNTLLFSPYLSQHPTAIPLCRSLSLSISLYYSALQPTSISPNNTLTTYRPLFRSSTYPYLVDIPTPIPFNIQPLSLCSITRSTTFPLSRQSADPIPFNDLYLSIKTLLFFDLYSQQ
jgi:hypothetical protein